ncbi:MAG TPA: decaprenyl-phosphate phosphoribosyltransferase [Verrucomicrobia bacterium]|nr:decaprenyl-phosphate phosphoribosyltransferase [Verrucomicrobiota bacterium]
MHESKPKRFELSALITAMRPAQWTKNAVVLAALAFGFGDKMQQVDLVNGLFRAVPAALLFCLVSSAVYLFNDLLDLKSDRQHPTKRFRPLASGRLSSRSAVISALVLLAIVFAGGWQLSVPFCSVLLGYVALQAVYTLFLKHVALLDVFIIAAGFVLRAIAGAAVFDAPEIPISPWLLLCTFLLALFLALCKRRQEKGSVESTASARQRVSLQKYDLQLLDQLIAAVTAATCVAYSIYTLWPETVEKFGSSRLGFTIPIVMFGMFRYLDLLYRQDKGDRPETLLLTDVPLLATVILYGLTVLAIFSL